MVSDRKVGGCCAATEYRQPLLEKISPFLECLRGIEDPARRRVRWTPLAASLAAVLMVLDSGCSLTVRCEDALACMRREPGHRGLGRTYNGLMKALERQAPAVFPTLRAHLRQRAAEALEKIPRVAGWTLLAVDGSKEELPRTCSHEDAFGIADNGACPQALIAAVVEVHTGLLWDWRIDRGRGSERDLLVQMIPELPGDALLLADAYYCGYPLWSALNQAGKRFLIRVAGGASLLTGLWPDAAIDRRGDTVYVWPVNHQRKVEPLRLRLIRVGSKNDPVYLLTNVLDQRALSRRAAGAIYRLRWGAELFYRTLKRTMGYAKLRSRNGCRAWIELEWGLIAAAAIAMLGIRTLHRRHIDPRRLSPAGLFRVLRRALVRQTPRLDQAIALAVRDRYVRRRPKRSRHRPITRITPLLRLKPPRLRRATPAEQRLARELFPHLAA